MPGLDLMGGYRADGNGPSGFIKETSRAQQHSASFKSVS
jgi:hypothetical protein